MSDWIKEKALELAPRDCSCEHGSEHAGQTFMCVSGIGWEWRTCPVCEGTMVSPKTLERYMGALWLAFKSGFEAATESMEKVTNEPT